MAKLENRFGWSATRGELLSEDGCRRAYFWAYYGGWGGWEKGAAPETKLAYRLKKLENRWAWSGNIVHGVIRRVIGDLRAKRELLPAAELVKGAQETMRREWKESNAGRRDAKNSRGWWGLVEHEYREPIPREEWAKIWGRVETSLGNFFRGRWIPWLKTFADAGALLELDEAGGEPKSFAWGPEGITIYAAPDLVLEVDAKGKRGALVVDWKTGKPSSSHADQVLGYALYTEAAHKIPRELVDGLGAYLLVDREVKFETARENFERYELTLQQGISRARELVIDGDLRKNKPKPLEAFPMTEDRDRCARCVYRRICRR